MDKPERYIPKEEMIDGQYYIGFCRNTFIALWDATENRFHHFRNKGVWFMEGIKHFDDVKGEATDGFVPLQIIGHPAFDEDVMQNKKKCWLKEFKIQIGY